MDDRQLHNKQLERLNRKLDQNLKEIEKQRIQDDCIKTIASMLPEDRFKEWIHSICLVTFDIELGQAIEVSAELCPDVRFYCNTVTLTKR